MQSKEFTQICQFLNFSNNRYIFYTNSKHFCHKTEVFFYLEIYEKTTNFCRATNSRTGLFDVGQLQNQYRVRSRAKGRNRLHLLPAVQRTKRW